MTSNHQAGISAPAVNAASFSFLVGICAFFWHLPSVNFHFPYTVSLVSFVYISQFCIRLCTFLQNSCICRISFVIHTKLRFFGNSLFTTFFTCAKLRPSGTTRGPKPRGNHDWRNTHHGGSDQKGRVSGGRPDRLGRKRRRTGVPGRRPGEDHRLLDPAQARQEHRSKEDAAEVRRADLPRHHLRGHHPDRQGLRPDQVPHPLRHDQLPQQPVRRGRHHQRG